MDRLIPLGIIIALIFLGFILKCFELKKVNDRLTFTINFYEKFVLFIDESIKTHKINNDLYIKILEEINAIQEELGSDGIASSMIDPLTNIKCSNYQILINFLPEIEQFKQFQGNSAFIMRFNMFSSYCKDSLVRHTGTLKGTIKKLEMKKFNLFSCFAYSISWILQLPINILYWCDLITQKSNNSIKSSLFFKILTFIITIIELLGSIVTIILGWQPLIDLIYKK